MRRWWWTLVAACQDPAQAPPVDLDPGAPMLLMATAADDYSVGGLEAWSPGWEQPVALTTLHGDSVVRVVDGRVFALNRLGMDTVRVWAEPRVGAPDHEVSVGRGANPHDVAKIGDRLLVTRYEASEAWWLDADDLAVLDVLDLSSHADEDGLPEMSGVVVVEEVAWVAMERLNRGAGWTPAGSGRVVGVDEGGREVGWHAVGPNPAIVGGLDGGWVVMADDGLWWWTAEGGLAGPWVPEGLPGRLVSLAPAGDGGWAGIAREGSMHRVVCLPGLGIEGVTWSDPQAVFLSSVAVWQDQIWLAARRGWDDPSVAGGLVSLPVDGCGALPDPETWIRGTLAPWSLAVWSP